MLLPTGPVLFTVAERTIVVEVAYATQAEQHVETLTVPVGSTAREVIERSGLPGRFPGIDVSKIGVFSRLIDIDDVLEEGDRVEVYRPLKADPKEVRRQLAKEGKTMGKAKS